MADLGSDTGVRAMNPPPKRRRILDPAAVVPVPVYSNKVSSSLQLKPRAATFSENETTDDGADQSLWSQFSSREPSAAIVCLSDSEEDEAEYKKKKTEVEAVRCPSPPPPQSPVQKQSRQVKRTISEVDRRLQALNSLLSPECQHRTRLRPRPPSPDDDVIVINSNDDIVVMTPNDDGVIAVAPRSGDQNSPYSSLVREIPLKIRCRTDVHKIPVLSTTPLSVVVTQLSVLLGVPPPRLLLLREDVELPTDSTVSELGIGIADIIECVVMAAEDKTEAGPSSSVITVRLQSKDRDSLQKFSLPRDTPLGPIFSQYLSKMSASAQRTAHFHFDGSKVTNCQTPAELDMEDGDIIEVWI